MSSRWRQLLLLLGRRFCTVLPSLPAAGRLLPGPVRCLSSTAVHWSPPRPGNGPPQGGWGEGPGDGEEGDGEDALDEEDEELLEEALPPLPLGAQQVFVVHPAIKRGPGRAQLTTERQSAVRNAKEPLPLPVSDEEWNDHLPECLYSTELQLAEAVALINTIQNWTVLDTLILSTKTPDKKFIFGKGNFQLLTEKIKGLPHVSAVFVNIERLSPLTKKELEEAWGVEVFDRYTVVLHIFRRNARTKEAKLQIALAEIPLLRANVRNEVAQMDQQRGGSRYIMGSGETFMEIQLRLLKEKELKIRKALEKLRRKRRLLRSQRKKREFPTISVMGYTNCGKTTLIKALTGDAGLQPQDQLFATLDITAHAGYLPSRLTVLYVDTIGFLSQLPHDLVESFSATLEDVACSDLIVHVRDISHPETNLQKESVLSVLRNLNLPKHLLDSIIEVHNKVDLIDGYLPTESSTIAISALLGHGLEELKGEIERTIMKVTEKNILTIKINLSGPQLSWLYKEATVQDIDITEEDGTASVKVIISNSALGRYRRLFPKSRYFSSP